MLSGFELYPRWVPLFNAPSGSFRFIIRSISWLQLRLLKERKQNSCTPCAKTQGFEKKRGGGGGKIKVFDCKGEDS